MKKFVKSKIKKILFIGNNYIHLVLDLKKNIGANPGQFVMVSKDGFEQIFPRPFSIFNLKENQLELLIKIVGRITKKISELKEGEDLNLLYPLGKPFPKENNVILVAGGYGIAPLYFYIMKNKGKNLKLFYGGKSKRDILFLKEIKKSLKNNSIFITTEDGTLGEKGLITKPLFKFLKKEKGCAVFACGPLPMLKEVAKISKENDTKAYMSLDPLMGCGYGVCLGCVIPTKIGNLCACTEGPILESDLILWEKM